MLVLPESHVPSRETHVQSRSRATSGGIHRKPQCKMTVRSPYELTAIARIFDGFRHWRFASKEIENDTNSTLSGLLLVSARSILLLG